MSDVYSQTLLRAAEIAGGIEQLGTRLGVSPFVLEHWLLGMQPVPPDVFLRAVDIVSAKDVDEITNPHIAINAPKPPDASH